MYLLIKFKDGSNPYVYYGFRSGRSTDALQGEAIGKEFQKWKRGGYFPDNYFTIHKNGLTIEHDHAGVWFIRHNNKAKTYKHLGNAINALLKMEGK